MADSSIVPAAQVRSVRQLVAWQRAMDLAVAVHRLSLTLPPFEKFELGSEMRRSGVSIPSNLAEGFGRHSRAAYRSHVGIALGSSGELETQLEIAFRLGYVKPDVAEEVVNTSGHVGRLLQGLWVSLE